MKKYYTLLTRESKDAKWAIQFGDYDKQTVEDEREDSAYDGCYTKVICTLDDQYSVDAKVAQLNEGIA